MMAKNKDTGKGSDTSTPRKKQRIDPRNIKGTGIAFDERDRAKIPAAERKAFEKWMDELAGPKGEWELGDGRRVKVSSQLVPKDWRTNKEYDRDYDYARAYLAAKENPELARAIVGPVYHEEDGKYWLHINDVGKLPTHPTFSTDSFYARNPKYSRLAGSWKGEVYIPGAAERETQQDSKGGDAGEGSAIPVPDSETPVQQGGPRIVINPSVFHDDKDALCVAFNEAFRIVMEEMEFNPVSEPTETQRKFFADTAYSQDENQMRRTILARIATFDTSVSDPTNEQLQETVEFLHAVLQVGAPQNDFEQRAVQQIIDVLSRVESDGVRTDGDTPEAPEPSGASVQADEGGGETDDDEQQQSNPNAMPADPTVPNAGPTDAGQLDPMGGAPEHVPPESVTDTASGNPMGAGQENDPGGASTETQNNSAPQVDAGALYGNNPSQAPEEKVKAGWTNEYRKANGIKDNEGLFSWSRDREAPEGPSTGSTGTRGLGKGKQDITQGGTKTAVPPQNTGSSEKDLKRQEEAIARGEKIPGLAEGMQTDAKARVLFISQRNEAKAARKEARAERAELQNLMQTASNRGRLDDKSRKELRAGIKDMSDFLGSRQGQYIANNAFVNSRRGDQFTDFADPTKLAGIGGPSALGSLLKKRKNRKGD